MRKIENNRSLKVLSAALWGVAALGTPTVAETVTVTPDMVGTELSNLNQLQTDEVRNFNFNSSEETYTVTKNLGTSTAGEININGIIGETAKSVIDLNTNKGFVLNGDATLNISNIEFKNAYTTSGVSVLDINKGTANLTNVDFTKNVFESSTENASGPIFNNGKINIISGAFNSNGAIGTGTRQGLGGAIDNSGNGFIETINANFVGNYTKSGNNNGSYGGAIYNKGSIGNITGNFDGNYALSDNNSSHGGAIFNRGSIADINGNFTNNYVLSETEQVTGGAISNSGNISSITGDFINNHLKTNGNALAYGAAISNAPLSNYSGTTTIKDIHGNFINNYSESVSGDTVGGITNQKATINSINGYFEGNYALSGGRASGGCN